MSENRINWVKRRWTSPACAPKGFLRLYLAKWNDEMGWSGVEEVEADGTFIINVQVQFWHWPHTLRFGFVSPCRRLAASIHLSIHSTPSQALTLPCYRGSVPTNPPCHPGAYKLWGKIYRRSFGIWPPVFGTLIDVSFLSELRIRCWGRRGSWQQHDDDEMLCSIPLPLRLRNISNTLLGNCNKTGGWLDLKWASRPTISNISFTPSGVGRLIDGWPGPM